jgi:hypothetical protein
MKKILFILILIMALSCNNDETETQTDKTALSLVTGVNFRETGDPNEIPRQLGNPNILVNNKLFLYPNPAIENVYISAQENVTDVWLVPANPEKIHQELNFNSILNTKLYSEQSIISSSNLSLNGQSSKSIGINIGKLPTGYYKVFVKINGEIYWDNLYKYENQGNNEEQFNAITNFWK